MRLTIQPLPMTNARRRAIRNAGAYYPALSELIRRRRALEGLGAACPAYAPYGDPETGCSNIPPNVDANAYFQAGGTISSTGVVSDQPAAADDANCPGMYRNPATGVLECPSDVQLMSMGYGRFGAISTPDEATARAVAAEAERLGRARGLSITCAPYVRGGDLLNNNKPQYGADCDMGGGPGAGRHDAALLLQAGGFETAAISASYGAGKPMSSIPQLTPTQVAPGAQDSRWLELVAPSSVQTVRTSPSQPSGQTTAPPAGPRTTAAGPSKTEQIFADVTTIADKAKTAASELPTWALIAGAAGVGLLLFRGKR